MVNAATALFDMKKLQSLSDIASIFNALPFFVLLIDENHHIVFANNAFAAHLGVHPKEIVGQYCSKTLHCHKSPISECPLEESCASGCAVEREIYNEKIGLWLSSSVYPTDLVTEQNTRIYLHIVHNISARKNAEMELKNTVAKLQELTESSIVAITRIVEQRDPYTAGHQTKVGKIAQLIALEMGLTQRAADDIRIAGSLHDIGKVAVPIEILAKPGNISEEEFNIIRKHPVVGYNILKDVAFQAPIADLVLQHHERLNGSGYPNGLKKNEISIGARILSVSDVFEAMTSYRPYRPGLSVESTLSELVKNKGTLYEPDAVDACVHLQSKNKFV